MNDWEAEITNNPNKNYELYIEILHKDKFVGRIFKNESSILQLEIYEGNEIQIPAKWLCQIIIKAEEDL